MDKFNVKDSPPDTSRLEKLFLKEGLLMKIKKNEYLVQQNEKNNQIGFVVSGIFRLSHTDANGNTWIVGYSFANDFVCDYPSFINRQFPQSRYKLLPNVSLSSSLCANLINSGKQTWTPND